MLDYRHVPSHPASMLFFEIIYNSHHFPLAFPSSKPSHEPLFALFQIHISFFRSLWLTCIHTFLSITCSVSIMSLIGYTFRNDHFILDHQSVHSSLEKTISHSHYWQTVSQRIPWFSGSHSRSIPSFAVFPGLLVWECCRCSHWD